MIWLIAFLTKNAAAIAIIGATAGAIQATEGAIINAVVLEKEDSSVIFFQALKKGAAFVMSSWVGMLQTFCTTNLSSQAGIPAIPIAQQQ